VSQITKDTPTHVQIIIFLELSPLMSFGPGLSSFILKLYTTSSSCILHPQVVYYILKLYTTSSSCILHPQVVYYILKLYTTSSSCILHPQAVYYILKLYTTPSSCILHPQVVYYILKLYTTSSSCILHPQVVYYNQLICSGVALIRNMDIHGGPYIPHKKTLIKLKLKFKPSFMRYMSHYLFTNCLFS